MVMAAMAWCDGYTAPLLVPLNGWLQPPLPLQIRAITCPQGVKLIEAAPSGQHVVVVPPQGDAQLWHVMSSQLVHTFKGRESRSKRESAACCYNVLFFVLFLIFERYSY